MRSFGGETGGGGDRGILRMPKVSTIEYYVYMGFSIRAQIPRDFSITNLQNTSYLRTDDGGGPNAHKTNKIAKSTRIERAN